MAPSVMHEQRPSYVDTAAPTPNARTNGSLLGVLIALIAVLFALGGWLLHRWRKLPCTRRIPATPELTIQDYKGPMLREDSILSYHVSYPSLAQPSPVYTPDRFYNGSDDFPFIAMQPASFSQHETMRYTMTPSIALPASETTRLSLNLPEAMSLSSEIECLVDIPSMSVVSSGKGGSTAGSIETEGSTSPVSKHMRLSQAELVRAIASGTQCNHLPAPTAPKPDHITSFTLPPIIGSPVLSSSQDLKAWCRPISMGKLMEELHLDLTSGLDYGGTIVRAYPSTCAKIPTSITEDELDLAFRRFSLLAFQNSVATISSAQEPPKASDFQFKMEPLPVQSVTARSATVTTPVSPRYRSTHHGQYQPWGTKSVPGTLGPSYSLPPWEKVALLSQCLPAMLRDDAGAEKSDEKIVTDGPLSTEQPPKRPFMERGVRAPNTPEFFFQGVRSQIFDYPAIPFSFGTPVTDAGCEDAAATPSQTSTPTVNQLTNTPQANENLMAALDTSGEQTPRGARSPVTLLPPLVVAPCDNNPLDVLVNTSPNPFRTGNLFHPDLATSSSHSLDEFTRELLHLVQNGRFSDRIEAEGMTPTISSASDCSLSRALAGIGLNFVQTPSGSETSLARWRLSVAGEGSVAVAAKRYIASRLSQQLEQSGFDLEENEQETGTTSDAAVEAPAVAQQTEVINETGMEDPTTDLPECTESDGPQLEASLTPAEEGSRGQVTSVEQDIDEQVNTNKAFVTTSAPDPTTLSLHNLGIVDPQAGEDRSNQDAPTPTYVDLCPPLVVVTSPTLAMCFQRFGINIDPLFVSREGEDPTHETDSDCASDSDHSSSGSEFEFDQTYGLVRKQKAEEDIADDVNVPATAPSSSTSASSASSEYSSHSSTSLSTSSTSSLSSTSSSKIPIPISSRSTAKLLASPVVDFTDGGKHSVQVVHRPRRYPDAEQERQFASFAHFTSTVIRRHRDDANASTTGIPVLQRRKSRTTATENSATASALASVSLERKITSEEASANSPSLYGGDSDEWLEKSDFGGCLMDETFPGGDSSYSLQTVTSLI
ncbi:hypothetical protein FRB96_004801 [Tulasnella sp. 330]|nr:hypothetical protein FRB96_004801 [Tulasnella sp. 330]KAG8877455.1 hypothetical protein FRB97_003386 [Tulasnella sp. 331]KAG8883330.1 hypothetical protein FRB98_003176 [Tulasnella sp. 332]